MALTQSVATSAREDEATVIGETLAIQGNIAGDESLTILGRVDGGIQLSDTLEIAHTGIVKADVSVEHAVISGILVGNVTASGSVHVTETGRLVGDISAPRVVIVAGARVRGQIDMAQEADHRGLSQRAVQGAQQQGRAQLPARAQQASELSQRAQERVRERPVAAPSRRVGDERPVEAPPVRDFGRPHLQERAHSVLTDLHPRYARAGSPLAVPLRQSSGQGGPGGMSSAETRESSHRVSGSVDVSKDEVAEDRGEGRPLQHVHVQSKKRHNRRRDG